MAFAACLQLRRGAEEARALRYRAVWGDVPLLRGGRREGAAGAEKHKHSSIVLRRLSLQQCIWRGVVPRHTLLHRQTYSTNEV